ncbi:MAG TPA: PAS domain S-box protein [Rhodocyclaceae bacterium]|jgi:PAS domain S-box-containing protein|nr:PAS domain S-box protein [Rhodocyclaceae bacterium]HMW77038.1 PAS domain S-box protein [Rhodocyclaceae bacterium]HNM81032.1 PAS domain S-box protein [Rhodocyclaceae bacterium]HNP04117.1 PAS domain S-box protein [Rhodocyclaceae bacterium]
MTDPRDITPELLSLYELSLTVGRSLEPREACREFLRALVTQRNLSAASLWWPDDDCSGLRLLDALPRQSVSGDRLPESHPLAEALPAFVSPLPEAILDFLAPGLRSGASAACTLDGQGLLLLHSASPESVAPRFLAQLRAVLAKLATAIRGSLAYVRLEESEARLRQRTRELDESRSLLEALIEGTTDSVFVKDPTGRYLLANEATCRFIGKPRDEILGSDDTALFAAETARTVMEHDRAILGRAVVTTLEESTVNGQGEAAVFLSTKGPLVDGDGNTLGLFGIAREITDRKLAEQELRKLTQALEQSPSSVIITDLDARIEYVNEAFCKITGYRRDEVLGLNPRILQSGKTPRETIDALWAALSANKPWCGEFVNRRKDGEEYVEYARLAPVRQGDGRTTHYLAVNEDISEKRRIADELDRYRNHLEELVNLRTRELQVASEAAEASNRAKGAFLANMSHEIRTPLNAINGMAHLIRRDGLTPRQNEKLDKLVAASDHLLEVINAILDLSRIESGKFTLEDTPVDVNDLMTSVADMVSGPLRAKGLALAMRNEVPPRNLQGDPTRLRQALLNYVSNAVKFTAAGHVTLCASPVDEDEGSVLIRFSVTDTGIGIPSEVMPRLFATFEQADNSTTRHYGGTGLGLAITLKLAELMGGDVGAESIQGSGSTFWFTARLRKSARAASRDSRQSSEETLRDLFPGRRILLVEDEPVNREIVSLMLREAGQKVDGATDGHEALALAAVGAYDLILMDMQMPTMDGLEATQRIRALPGGEAIPIVAFTANAFDDDRERCFAAGMDDFLPKPVVPEALYATTLKWLDRN